MLLSAYSQRSSPINLPTHELVYRGPSSEHTFIVTWRADQAMAAADAIATSPFVPVEDGLELVRRVFTQEYEDVQAGLIPDR